MATYIDVGTKRIQEYITRTSGSDEGQLRKRRGASRMISEATDPKEFTHLGLVANEETYAVEGVVHLKTEDVADPAAIAEAALRQLRGALPHAYVQVSWAVAQTYAAARVEIDRVAQTSAGNPQVLAGVRESLPAYREDPYAARCGSCGLAPAISGSDCEDCRRRDEAGRSTPRPGAADTPEGLAVRAVAALNSSTVRRVKDLRELATLPLDDRLKRNHLATIYADGNNVGNLMSSIDDLATAKRVSAAINDAITSSGYLALAELMPRCRPGVLPGIVTVLAADDALVTVPAPYGWAVATAIIHGFAAVMDDAVARGVIRPGEPVPSFSAGIAFSHMKSPIEQAIRSADAAMRAAKKAFRGTAAIGWVDVTHPVQGPAAHRSTQWLTERRSLLDGLTELPASQRAKWERDIADARAAHIPEDRILSFLTHEATRLDIPQFRDSTVDLDEIGHLLAIARWWSSTGTATKPEVGGQ